MGKRNVNTGMLIHYEPAASVVDSDPLAILMQREGDGDEVDALEQMYEAGSHVRRSERDRTGEVTDLLGASPSEIWDYHHRNSALEH